MWCSGEMFPKWGVLLLFLLILHFCLSPTTRMNSFKHLCKLGRDFVVNACRDSADSSILTLSTWNLNKTSYAFIFPDTFMIEKINEFRLNAIVVLCKKRRLVNIFIFFLFSMLSFYWIYWGNWFQGYTYTIHHLYIVLGIHYQEEMF